MVIPTGSASQHSDHRQLRQGRAGNEQPPSFAAERPEPPVDLDPRLER
jgi:hypothetical protein